MKSVSFTTRIDRDLKAELDRIGAYEGCSASYLANLAIRAFVEERLATRSLIDTGLALAGRSSPGIAANAVHDWLAADDDCPFPEAGAVG